MKLKVQLVVCDDDGDEETFTDVVVLEKACQRIEHLGLTLTEAKQTLTALQQRLVEQQCGSRIFVAIGLLDFSASPLHPDIKPCCCFPGFIFSRSFLCDPSS
jgi:hypothetical protein